MVKMNIFLIMIFAILAVGYCQSEPMVVFTGYNIVGETLFTSTSSASEYMIYYDHRISLFVLCEKYKPQYQHMESLPGYKYVLLNESSISLLRIILEKYLEWEKIAVSQKVKLQKDIPGGLIKVEERESIVNDKMNIIVDLRFTFFSQNENRHQLVISEIQPSDPYGWKTFRITIFQHELYIDKKDILSILESIEEKKIQLILSDAIEAEEKKSLFD